MKKEIFSAAIFMMLCSSCFYACSHKNIYSNYDPRHNFSQYHSFAWMPKTHHLDTIKQLEGKAAEMLVKHYGSNELTRRGLQVNIKEPDLLVDFFILVHHKDDLHFVPVYAHSFDYLHYNTDGSHRYWNNAFRNKVTYMTQYNSSSQMYGAQSYAPNVSTYEYAELSNEDPQDEETLVITITDRKTNKVIWEAGHKSILTDEVNFENELHPDFVKMFKSFPIPVKKKK